MAGGSDQSPNPHMHASIILLMEMAGRHWQADKRTCLCLFSLGMNDQMKSICKIFLEMSTIFRDESNDGN